MTAGLSVALLFCLAVNLQADESLNGVWQAEAGEISGRKLPAALIASMQLTMRNGAYQNKSKTLSEEGTYATNTAKSPNWLDITSVKGPTKGKVTVAIYELQDDKLKICYTLEGTARPAGFSTNPESYQLLLTYKKIR